MELTYNELSKRDVINISDGRVLGRICNVNFSFPEGILTSIFVPSKKKKGLFWFLDKSTLCIEVSKIIKIGGDVILVDLKCRDREFPSIKVNGIKEATNSPCLQQSYPPYPACPPKNCSPKNCPPKNCPPPKPKNENFPRDNYSGECGIDLSSLYDQNGRLDMDDY